MRSAPESAGGSPRAGGYPPGREVFARLARTQCPYQEGALVQRSTLLAFLFLCLPSIAAAEERAGAAVLEKLRTLSGDWEGSFEWSGARSGKGRMNASYYSTGNGSAVVENVTMGGVPVMTSGYHRHRADTPMTHF